MHTQWVRPWTGVNSFTERSNFSNWPTTHLKWTQDQHLTQIQILIVGAKLVPSYYGYMRLRARAFPFHKNNYQHKKKLVHLKCKLSLPSPNMHPLCFLTWINVIFLFQSHKLGSSVLWFLSLLLLLALLSMWQVILYPERTLQVNAYTAEKIEAAAVNLPWFKWAGLVKTR